MPIVTPPEWEEVTEHGNLADEHLGERASPFSSRRVVASLLVVSVVAVVLPYLAILSPHTKHLVGSGSAVGILSQVDRSLVAPRGAPPLDTELAANVTILVMLVNATVLFLFVAASWTLLDEAVRAAAKMVLVSIVCSIAILGAGTLLGDTMRIPSATMGSSCAMLPLMALAVVTVASMTSYGLVAAMAAVAIPDGLDEERNWKCCGRKLCRMTWARLTGKIGLAGAIAMPAASVVSGILFRASPLSASITRGVTFVVGFFLLVTNVITCVTESRSCCRAITAAPSAFGTAMRFARLLAVSAVASAGFTTQFAELAAGSDLASCPAYFFDVSLPLPSEAWPAGCDTMPCFSNVVATLAIRERILWIATGLSVVGLLVVILASQANVAATRERDSSNAAQRMRQALQYVSHEARAPLGGAILSMGLLDHAIETANRTQAGLLVSDLHLSLEAAQRQLTDLLLFESDTPAWHGTNGKGGASKAASDDFASRWSKLDDSRLDRLRSFFAGACRAEGIALDMELPSGSEPPTTAADPAELSVAELFVDVDRILAIVQNALSNSIKHVRGDGTGRISVLLSLGPFIEGQTEEPSAAPPQDHRSVSPQRAARRREEQRRAKELERSKSRARNDGPRAMLGGRSQHPTPLASSASGRSATTQGQHSSAGGCRPSRVKSTTPLASLQGSASGAGADSQTSSAQSRREAASVRAGSRGVQRQQQQQQQQQQQHVMSSFRHSFTPKQPATGQDKGSSDAGLERVDGASPRRPSPGAPAMDVPDSATVGDSQAPSEQVRRPSTFRSMLSRPAHAHPIDQEGEPAEKRVLWIEVLDNGRGIPARLLQPGRLFRPFQQVRQGDGSLRMTSSGLGLSIVKSVVVEQLHGTVGLASEEGEGTLFTAKIPVWARRQPVSAASSVHSWRSRLSQMSSRASTAVNKDEKRLRSRGLSDASDTDPAGRAGAVWGAVRGRTASRSVLKQRLGSAASESEVVASSGSRTDAERRRGRSRSRSGGLGASVSSGAEAGRSRSGGAGAGVGGATRVARAQRKPRQAEASHRTIDQTTPRDAAEPAEAEGSAGGQARQQPPGKPDADADAKAGGSPRASLAAAPTSAAERRALREERRRQRQAQRDGAKADAAGPDTAAGPRPRGARAARAAGAGRSGRRRGRETIGTAFVVDDERVNRTLMARLLRSWGFEVREMEDGTGLVEAVRALVARDASSATGGSGGSGGSAGSDPVTSATSLAAAAANEVLAWPLVVTLDIQMPVMDGFQALEALRALAAEQRAAGNEEVAAKVEGLLVIGVTGNAVLSDRQRMMDLGAQRVLTKPVDTPALASLIEECGDVDLPAKAHRRIGSRRD
ncbi:hypothetical protein FNF27_03699 [Cafeteria roenbergensis]|uniref:histidine kinase n=1 Tax=Cafeteria roenbergensis TaxID=33653 RepID=A0A5A8EB58_CAFRO|nr:hypothetical protein FNF27_03699 [Cafeteria roenbergensis]